MAGAAKLFYFTLSFSQHYANKLCKSARGNLVPEISKESVFHHENVRIFVFMPQGWSLIIINLHKVARQSSKQDSRFILSYFLLKF